MAVLVAAIHVLGTVSNVVDVWAQPRYDGRMVSGP
jgi:hypothetical protein